MSARRLVRVNRRDKHTQLKARTINNKLRFFRFLLIAALALLTATAASGYYFYNVYAKLVDERLAAGYLTSRAGIYAAPRVLRVGDAMTRERLAGILRRADYIEGESSSDVWNGRFGLHENVVEIHTRRAYSQTQPANARVRFDVQGRIAELTNASGARLSSYALEPELLTNDRDVKTNSRAALAFSDIPPVLVQAILSIEDRRFFEHRGVDGRAILRALWNNASEDHAQQGGSTITQQLVKNTYLTPERTLRRKFAEAMIAFALERRLSKQDIFALYCNEIYLGQRGAIVVRGMAQAARVFFGKELQEISLAEAATLAGMIRSPARFAPHRRPIEAQARRDTVLAAMLRDEAVTLTEAERASAESLRIAPLDNTSAASAPYFIDYVNRVVEVELQNENGDDDTRRVHTTLDLELQELATAALERQLAELDLRRNESDQRVQGALVALDPQTGRVLAMVGGREYAVSQLNRVTDARRQPGSVFKPIVYAAALESGSSPLTMYADAPREFAYDRRAIYRPSNYGGAYSMRDVMMREGLVRSLNVVTVDVALRAGLEHVAGLAERFGLPRSQPFPALALGTTEATPLEIAAAYAAFANGGRRITPYVIERANDSINNHPTSEEATNESQQIIQPSTAYMITDMLADVIERGTGRAARQTFHDSGAMRNTAVAGKTGTSRDGWFVGYTPNLVCAVWIGFDDNSQLGLTGAESALPVWTDFVRGAVEMRPELGGANFRRPAGIFDVEIDPDTGLLASPSCPHRQRAAMNGALAYPCYAHGESPQEIASFDEGIHEPTVTLTRTRDESLRTATITPLTRTPSATRNDTRSTQTPPPNRTQVETNTHGQRTLINEIRVDASRH